MDAANKQLHELRERIEKHPGKRIHDALKVYDMSKFIFDGNCHQLRQLIKTLEHPESSLELMSEGRRQQLDWLFHDMNRHIHNFLTSITTLVDHTRNLMREDFIKTEHRTEYESRVQSVFASEPLARFLQDFRNYITHYAIPEIGLHKQLGSAKADAEPARLYIDLDRLESGFNWSAPSRKFIAENRSEIRMMKLLDDYEQKANFFFRELMLSFQKHLGHDLNEVRSLMQQSNQLWTQMFKEAERKSGDIVQ